LRARTLAAVQSYPNEELTKYSVRNQ